MGGFYQPGKSPGFLKRDSGGSTLILVRSGIVACAIFLSSASQAQLNTGILEGAIRSQDGVPETGFPVVITGANGFRASLHTNGAGEFSATLVHGRYTISNESGSSGPAVFIAALATTRVDLTIDRLGGLWLDTTRALSYPEPFSILGLLLSREPGIVTDPLNFTGTHDSRLAIISGRAFSWTSTQFQLEGMNATDSYQPGRPVILPDVQAFEEISVRSGFAQTTSSSYGPEIGLFSAEPRARWHGSLQSVNMGSGLSASNLPPPQSRGLVQQSDYFHWFTRNTAQIGGPITKWADIFASATGQYSKQTVPLQPVGTDQRNRSLYGNVRGRIRAGERNSFDALFTGSRINLNNFGMPAGFEALAARRDSPSFVLPMGFAGQSEVDHLDFLQAGWMRTMSAASGLGAIQVRYQFSTGHLDTTRSAPATSLPQSRIELLDGAVTGAPPMENLAKRTQHQIEGVWQSGFLRHRITAGAGWRTQEPENRITAPSDMNLITANGAAAFILQLNTPLDSKSRMRAVHTFIADHWSLARTFSIEAGLLADFSRGSLPAQSSGLGIFEPIRNFAAQPDLIAWNSASPRVGFAWRLPRLSRIVVRGSYLRLYAPLSGHALDFANPNSLGGTQYQWIDRNRDGVFQPGELGFLLMRFGGPYSSIDPHLRRPYSDEFDVGAEARVAARTTAGIHLYRRDEKDRLAAVNVGVPSSAYTPITLVDPGDGTDGKSFEQLNRLTVYSQNPATFGQDRYLLTNPANLRFMNTGLTADLRTEIRGFLFEATFVAEKAFGPTNPGDSPIANDPGVIGSLYMDPNTLINARGRSYFDRGYIGKIRASYRLPLKIDLTSVADYLDGLVFGRQLLVTNLAQGPTMIAATIRGSPEGGNRAQYVFNWNMRAQREFRIAYGTIAAAIDAMNVLNYGQSIQQSDVSSSTFILRFPVAIQEPRSFRFLVRYDF